MLRVKLGYQWAEVIVPNPVTKGGAEAAHDLTVPRLYPEFLIAGVPLKDLLAEQARGNGFAGDSWQSTFHRTLIAPFGWGHMTWQEWRSSYLLGNTPADLDSGRRSLLVCPTCGGSACEAISIDLGTMDNRVIWRDFAYDSDGVIPLDFAPFRGLGPFVFDRSHYEGVLREVCRIASPGDQGPPMTMC